jgi:ribosomal protein S18 acetylase RimI-like enzyme
MSDKIATLYPLKGYEESNSNLHKQHLEYLRRTRNSSKEFMTRCQDIITPEIQEEWYNNLPNNINPYIFIISEMGSIFYSCGYGIIAMENDVAMLTGVIEELNRGKGFGKQLFLNLIEEAKKKTDKIQLEVLETNLSAINLYKSIGFVQTSIKNNIIDMKLKL